MKTVSIVILNWRSYPIVMDAAQSALAQRGVNVELIVVDNGSRDGSIPELRLRFPAARIIELGNNSGFPNGMNTGITAATGEYVLLQNADLVLDENYCAFGLSVMSSIDRVGAVGGLVQRLVKGERTDTLDACGYTLSSSFRARLLDQEQRGEVVGVSGSCPLFSAAALRDAERPVGYALDPWYFSSFEDIDLMLRINLAGWAVYYEPTMRAWHVRSGSTVTASRFYGKPVPLVRHHMKNRLATVIKNVPAAQLRTWLGAILTEIGIPVYLLWKRPAALKAWIGAWWSIAREATRLMSDRRRILRNAAPELQERLFRLIRTTRLVGARNQNELPSKNRQQTHSLSP